MSLGLAVSTSLHLGHVLATPTRPLVPKVNEEAPHPDIHDPHTDPHTQTSMPTWVGSDSSACKLGTSCRPLTPPCGQSLIHIHLSLAPGLTTQPREGVKQ